jgi:hypothetical protein
MGTQRKFALGALFLPLVVGSIVLAFSLAQGACCDDDQRKKSGCPNVGCTWERSDTKCNNDSDCCPGKQCSAFGMCEACR